MRVRRPLVRGVLGEEGFQVMALTDRGPGPLHALVLAATKKMRASERAFVVTTTLPDLHEDHTKPLLTYDSVLKYAKSHIGTAYAEGGASGVMLSSMPCYAAALLYLVYFKHYKEVGACAIQGTPPIHAPVSAIDFAIATWLTL